MHDTDVDTSKQELDFYPDLLKAELIVRDKFNEHEI